MAAAQSPASSPRLPSPPPVPEDQIGPTSPGVALSDEHAAAFPGGGGGFVDAGAARRIRPGSRAEEMHEGPPVVELAAIDSAFQATEHLKALHYAFTHGATQALDSETAARLATPPDGSDRELWLYELCRLLVQQTNAIIVALFADAPPCSPVTCPEMRASEWQYLCAVHEPPKSCAAIDYCCHTLDWAAYTIASLKHFPSRLGLGSGARGDPAGVDRQMQMQMKEIKNIFRRVYRIYAHAWFSHRDMFWRVEAKMGLYLLFKRVCDEYSIIEADSYTIPAEAEGIEPPETPHGQPPAMQAPPSVLKREQDASVGMSATQEQTPAGNNVLAMGDTTKRHRHTISDLTSSASNVIQEEAEEEDDQDHDTSALDTHAPSQHDLSAELDAGPEEQEEEAPPVPPVPGIVRSDTIKSLKDDEAGDAEKTVLETMVEDKDDVTDEDLKKEDSDEKAPLDSAESLPEQSTLEEQEDVKPVGD